MPGITIGGNSLDANPLLAQLHWQQQEQERQDAQAYQRNLQQATHTANMGAENFQFHQQQDALARHAAELATQQAQHDQQFARAGQFHADDLAHQGAVLENLKNHQAAELAFQQAEEARRIKAETDRQEAHKADMQARLDAAVGAKRQSGVSKYEGGLDRATRELTTDANRYGAPLTTDEIRAQAERDMSSHQFAPPNMDNGPLLPQFEHQPSDFQRAVPNAPDTFPPEDTGEAVSSPSQKWDGGPLTMPEPPVDAKAAINQSRRDYLGEKDSLRKRALELEDKRITSGETKEAAVQGRFDQKINHASQEQADVIRMHLSTIPDPQQQKAYLQYEYQKAIGQPLSEGVNPYQDADIQRFKLEAAANPDLQGNIKSWQQKWDEHYKPQHNVTRQRALLSVINGDAPAEEAPRVGTRQPAQSQSPIQGPPPAPPVQAPAQTPIQTPPPAVTPAKAGATPWFESPGVDNNERIFQEGQQRQRLAATKKETAPVPVAPTKPKPVSTLTEPEFQDTPDEVHARQLRQKAAPALTQAELDEGASAYTKSAKVAPSPVAAPTGDVPTLTPEQARAHPEIKKFRTTDGRLFERG